MVGVSKRNGEGRVLEVSEIYRKHTQGNICTCGGTPLACDHGHPIWPSPGSHESRVVR